MVTAMPRAMDAGVVMGNEIPTHFGQMIDRLMSERTRGKSRRAAAAEMGMNLGTIDTVIGSTKPGMVYPTTIAALATGFGVTPLAMCRVVFERDLGMSFDGGTPAGGPVLTPEEIDLLRSAQPEELRAILGLLRELRARRGV